MPLRYYFKKLKVAFDLLQAALKQVTLMTTLQQSSSSSFFSLFSPEQYHFQSYLKHSWWRKFHSQNPSCVCLFAASCRLLSRIRFPTPQPVIHSACTRQSSVFIARPNIHYPHCSFSHACSFLALLHFALLLIATTVVMHFARRRWMEDFPSFLFPHAIPAPRE